MAPAQTGSCAGFLIFEHFIYGRRRLGGKDKRRETPCGAAHSKNHIDLGRSHPGREKAPK
jgi:hypothetical protein